MIVRVVVKNLFSFKEQTEFHAIPGQATRLKHHKYKAGSKELLKLSAIYGANGSGKSNFIKAVSLLRRFVITGDIPLALSAQKFKLSQQNASAPSEVAIEFFYSGKLYYYSIAVDQGKVEEEYLCTIDQKTDQDELLFQRTREGIKTTLNFFKEFETKAENKVLKNIIEKDLLKPEKSLLNLISSLSNDSFDRIKKAYAWIANDLVIIFPTTKATSLPITLDRNEGIKDFASELMCSFGTGISGFIVDKKPLEEYMGENERAKLEEMQTRLTNDPKLIVAIRDRGTGEEAFAQMEDGKILAKRIFFEHQSEGKTPVSFNFSEESDGTRRLIEYLPALFALVTDKKTYLIDEIERSVHPVIIKELISKFSHDSKTKGQLIFTTHESNLLDQEIFRTDEIWFAQKNKSGASKLYSLSEFKEHNTIDIRKGYLNGRYGAIPFIGNLHDLNWNKYAE